MTKDIPLGGAAPKLAATNFHAVDALGVPSEDKYYNLVRKMCEELTATAVRVIADAGGQGDQMLARAALAAQVSWAAMSAGHSIGAAVVDSSSSLTAIQLAARIVDAFAHDFGDSLTPSIVANVAGQPCGDPNCPVHGKTPLAGEPLPAAPEAPPAGTKLH